MNNKGQSLVLFVLIIPILLGMIVLVVDVGNAMYEKNKINNKIEMVIEYGLDDKYTEEQVEELMDYNFDYDYLVDMEDNKINITVNTYVDGVISNVLDVDGFEIVSEYIGYMENDKKVIEKVK